jgi:hypothetical protein
MNRAEENEIRLHASTSVVLLLIEQTFYSP